MTKEPDQIRRGADRLSHGGVVPLETPHAPLKVKPPCQLHCTITFFDFEMFFRSGDLGAVWGVFSAVGKNLILISNFVPQCQYDLSLGFYATAHTSFNPINGQGRNLGFPGKLCLA